MKRILFVFLFLLVAMVGCSSAEQDNLLTYINDDVKPLAPLEEEVINEYESVTGANFTDDQTLHTALTETIIPKYEELVDKAEGIGIDDEDISDVHEIYVSAANHQLEAFHSFVEAIEAQDTELIDEANATLQKGFQGMQEYRTEIQSLADERDVELEEEQAS